MGLNEARERFREMLPDALRAAHVAAMEDDERAKLLDIKAGVLQAFEEAAPRPAPPVRIQRVDEYLAPGKYASTYEVVDTRVPGKGRIVGAFPTREEAETRRQKAYLIPVGDRMIRPIGGAAYTYAAVDADEYWHDTDAETIASVHTYGVISGCTVTGDAANMTVDLAAGVILHSGSSVTVAGAADAYTLVSDGSNERWAALCISSAGAAALVSGDPAASASSEPSKPEIGDRVVVAMAKIQAAQTIAANVEYMLDKRVITHVRSELLAYKTSTQVFTTNITFADVTAQAGGSGGNMAFAIAASEAVVARFVIPVTFGGTGGVKFQLTGPSSPTVVNATAHFPVTSLATTGLTSTVTSFSSAIMSRDTTSQMIAGTVYIDVLIVNGSTAGTVTLQAAQDNANSTTTLAVGSYMTVRRLATS